MAKATCAIDGCSNPHRCRGMCGKHYTRWQRHGDPNLSLQEKRSRERRALTQPIADDYESGASLSDLAERYGISQTTVFRHLEDAGVDIRGNRADDGLYESLHLEAEDGVCKVSECQDPPGGHGLCTVHYERARRKGWLDIRPKGAWSYSGAHSRVHRAWGRASNFKCVKCGKQAAEWAYDHLDPDEIKQDHGFHAGYYFSQKIEHYHPMCLSCHYYLDRPYLEAPHVG